MTRQEKWIVAGLLAAFLLGMGIRTLRRGSGHNLPHPALKPAPASP
jgi:hypothetical protein